MSSSTAAGNAPAAASAGQVSPLSKAKSPRSLDAIVSPNHAHTELPSASLTNPPSPPARRIVSSASELPQKGIKSAVFSHHVASDQYVESHRKAMSQLHEAHRHERATWQIERHELYLTIAELESKIKRFQKAALDIVSQPSAESKITSIPVSERPQHRSASTPGDYASARTTRQASVGTSASHVEEQGFPEKNSHAMQSIPEDREMDRRKSVTFVTGGTLDADLNKALEGYTIPGSLIDQDYDGITIKATGLPTATKKAILEESGSNTPSPAFSPTAQQGANSPAAKRPVAIEIPSTMEVMHVPAADLRKHAAGSTPLARLADENEDEAAGVTAGNSPSGIRIGVAEREKPPLEPYPSAFDLQKPLRPPNERSDSYFNVPITDADKENEKPIEEESPDQDPALTGPLTLPSHPAPGKGKNTAPDQSSEFMTKLDRALNVVARKQSTDATKKVQPDDQDAGMANDPPLRIRRSINFGSQLGQGPR